MKKIRPDRITAFRANRGLSEKELAAKVGVDGNTVSRWERGKQPLRPGNLGKLCKALGVTEAELCRDDPLPGPSISGMASTRSQLNLPINDACRNALMLVGKRYDVSAYQIIEAAPLIFFILAEASLRKRKKRISQELEKLNALRDGPLAFLATLGSDELSREEASINDRNLAGPDSEHAFAHDLSNWLKQLDPSAKSVQWGGFGLGYEICKDEASELVGGDSEAAKAILSGTVPLRKAPVAARKSAGSELAAWVKKFQPDPASSETDDLVTPFEHPSAEALDLLDLD